MIDTAALTAAIETLQGYCEQVRHVMVARGYKDGHASMDIGLAGHPDFIVWIFQRIEGPAKQFNSRDGDPFVAALAYAESLSPAPTPDDFAATIGIAPDGRLLAAE